jgi:hypothetical protein
MIRLRSCGAGEALAASPMTTPRAHQFTTT